MAAIVRKRVYQVAEEILIEKVITESENAIREKRIHVVPLRSDHLDELLAFSARHGDGAAQRIREYVRIGYGGYLGYQDAELVGYLFYCGATCGGVTHPHVERYQFELGQDGAYVFEIYLAPPFRGGGRARELVARCFARMAELGYRRLSGFVYASNMPARILHAMLGWRETRRVVSRRVLSRWLICDGVVYVRNRPASRPHGFDYRRVFGRRATR
ncbi:MAG: hypothetical protein CHACPFDD_02649 [Phycisphaerae bacterium]|nr:hypothetical protein [Phycisphaerae bacterium]